MPSKTFKITIDLTDDELAIDARDFEATVVDPKIIRAVDLELKNEARAWALDQRAKAS